MSSESPLRKFRDWLVVVGQVVHGMQKKARQRIMKLERVNGTSGSSSDVQGH